ncbi:MAG: hypothetical protein LC800_16965 [Acidobacteria bacterium]|nr:hypothetical protein [Acidobacteriota bacterium]
MRIWTRWRTCRRLHVHRAVDPGEADGRARRERVALAELVALRELGVVGVGLILVIRRVLVFVLVLIVVRREEARADQFPGHGRRRLSARAEAAPGLRHGERRDRQ